VGLIFHQGGRFRNGGIISDTGQNSPFPLAETARRPPLRVVRGSFLSGCGWPRCVGCLFFHQFFLFFFYLHLPSAAFICLHLPSLVKVPKGGLEGFLAVPPARPGPAGPATQRVRHGFRQQRQGRPSPARRPALAEEASSCSRRAAGSPDLSGALPSVTNAWPRPGRPEGKLTASTFLMREE